MSLFTIAETAVLEHGAQQKQIELAALLALAQSIDPVTVCEIGTATGGTLWALASTLRYGPSYVSIDLPNGPYGGNQMIPEGELRDLLESADAEDIRIVRGDSRSVEIPYFDAGPILLLIDGDHSYEGVLADWVRYAPLVTSGMIGLHDVLPHRPESGVEVNTLWQEIRLSEPSTIEIADYHPADHGGLWGGWGVVFR